MLKKITSIASRAVAAVGAGALALTTAVPALAQTAPDLSGLTDQVDFSTTTAAILLIGGALMVVYIVVKASMLVIGMVKRG